MSNGDDTQSSLEAFFKAFSAPIVAAIAVITTIFNFVKLFTDKDVGLITIISLGVGGLVLLGICLYYARFWRPEKQDKGQSAFAPSLSDEQVKAQAKKERQRKWVRRSAIAGLVLIPLLSLAGVAGWHYVQNRPTNDIIILVADFDGPDPKKYGVTDLIAENLRLNTKEYKDVKVKPLDKIITRKQGSDVAKEEGKKQKAEIVIWGWYIQPKDDLLIRANFELLSPPKYLPELDKKAGELQGVSLAELEELNVKIRPASEMAYLTLVIVGMSRYAANDYDGAIIHFTNALEQVKKPVPALSQADIYFYRGNSYQSKGKQDKAINDFNQAINLKHDFANAYNNRGLAHSNKQDYDRAIADYTQAISFKPGYAEAYYNRGNAYQIGKRNYDQAIANYTQALQLNPQLSQAYNNRGIAHTNKQDYDRAIQDFTQTLSLKPNDAKAYYNRGLAYYGKRNYDKAITDYTQALKLKHDYPEAYNNRGNAYREKKDYDRAIADYTQTLSFNYGDAYYNRGVAYSVKQDYDRAIADFKQALKLKHDQAKVYYDQGLTYYLKKDYNKAIANFTKAIQINRNWGNRNLAGAYYNRGNVYSDKEEYDKAIADYNQALKLNPNYAEAWYFRGTAYSLKQDYDQAIVSFNQHLKLKPNDADAHTALGTAYVNKQDYDRAIAEYTQAIHLNSSSDIAYYLRGLVHQYKGDKEKAVKDFRKVLELTKNPRLQKEVKQELQKLGVK